METTSWYALFNFCFILVLFISVWRGSKNRPLLRFCISQLGIPQLVVWIGGLGFVSLVLVKSQWDTTRLAGSQQVTRNGIPKKTIPYGIPYGFLEGNPQVIPKRFTRVIP